MKKVILFALLGASLAGCAGQPLRPREHNALVGGAVGAAVGCGIGTFWGGAACAPGAAIGGTVGTVAGAMVPVPSR